jgi:hypothetical protein
MEKLQAVGKHTDTADVSRLLRYVLGHLLLNGILRFPGPIISKRPSQRISLSLRMKSLRWTPSF